MKYAATHSLRSSGKAGRPSVTRSICTAFGAAKELCTRKLSEGWMKRMDNKFILKQIEEIKEVSDIKEVAQILSSGNWISICATKKEPYCFCLARIKSRDNQ